MTASWGTTLGIICVILLSVVVVAAVNVVEIVSFDCGRSGTHETVGSKPKKNVVLIFTIIIDPGLNILKPTPHLQYP
jgi:hypothetical protein